MRVRPVADKRSCSRPQLFGRPLTPRETSRSPNQWVCAVQPHLSWLERIYAGTGAWPPKGVIRAAGSIQRFAIVSSGGRLGTALLDHPVLLLHTIGRRTGKTRIQPLTVEGRQVPVLATIATPEERERLWPRFLSLSAAYAKVQRSTSRLIPIVKLSPSVRVRGQIYTPP